MPNVGADVIFFSLCRAYSCAYPHSRKTILQVCRMTLHYINVCKRIPGECVILRIACIKAIHGKVGKNVEIVAMHFF